MGIAYHIFADVNTHDVCDFDSPYICGYQNQANSSIKWVRMNALQITEELGPKTDSSGSVLGK